MGMLSEEHFLTAVRWLLKLFFGGQNITTNLYFTYFKRDRANRLDQKLGHLGLFYEGDVVR